MTIPAHAIEEEIHQLIQFQIETFGPPTSLSSSQLYDHHFRAWIRFQPDWNSRCVPFVTANSIRQL